ncbi:VTT domain-containing protein [Candidatus Gracilibacteria bacterium]|nr:VTT domain-containing protein [Candidatus Gracilibacteria bacterium]
MNKKLARNILYSFILLNIAAIWYFSYTDHPYFNIQSIQDFLKGQNLYIGLLIYIFILILRGLTIFPGTPLLIIGALVFPTVHAIVAIEIAVQCYVLIIHKYSEILDFKVPKKIMGYEKKIEKYGVPYIILICLVPGMSINILTYFLSILKVPLKTKMIGIGIGSIISIFVYLHIFKAVFHLST